MHIHTLEAKKNFEIPQRGCATPPNIPKINVSDVKDIAKTNKDLGMSCYIPIEYSVFSAGSSFFNHVKIIFKNI